MSQTLFSTAFTETRAAFRRFPVPVLSSLLFFLTAASQHKEAAVLLPVLFCTCFWFISVTLVAESRAWPRLRLYAVACPVAVLIAWHLSGGKAALPSFWFLGSGLFLSMFIAPFLRRDATSGQIWVFNYRLWLHIAFVFLAAFVLFLGLTAIFASMAFLFGFNFGAFFSIWLFCATLFAPIFAMARIPRDFTAEPADYPRPVRLIICSIVLPLLLVYAVLLYGYILKIALTWTLPDGGVAWLVSGFGGIGLLAWLAGFPLQREPGPMQVFSRNFPRLLIAPLGLLAAGIFMRIHTYGVTEERYAILLALAWLSFSAALMLAGRNRDAPKWIFTSAIALLLLASFGPWSAVGVSDFSQMGRLRAVLERNGMLAGNKITPATGSVSFEDSAEISSILDYLTDRHRTASVEAWLPQPGPDHSSRDSESLAKLMGIEYIGHYNRNQDIKTRSHHFQVPYAGSDEKILVIAGYDVLISNISLVNEKPETLPLAPDRSLTLSLGKEKGILTLTDTSNGGSATVDLRQEMARLVRDTPRDRSLTDLPSFTLAPGSTRVRIDLKSLSVEQDLEHRDAPLTLNSISFTLLAGWSR
jgi:hypothetical protein